MLSRRQALLGAAALLEPARVSVITDEVAASEAEAFAFCRQYGLRLLETRMVPGTRRPYWDLDDSEQTAFAAALQRHQLQVSFVDSSLLACPLPGTEPLPRRGETPESRAKWMAMEGERFANRFRDLERVMRFAGRIGCRRLRCFAFRRVAEPARVFPQIVDRIAPLAERAQREGMELALENESSCNVNTGVEIAGIFRLLPDTVKLNWDPGNAATVEKAYPDAYRHLPLGRLVNVQVKGKGILPGREEPVDWKAIVVALRRDGYRGAVGLETHTPNRYADSHLAIKELLRLMA